MVKPQSLKASSISSRFEKNKIIKSEDFNDSDDFEEDDDDDDDYSNGS